MSAVASEIDCLIDTGARVPVWCGGVQSLYEIFPASIKQNAMFILSGFGNGYEVAPVYLIPEFMLFDGFRHIIFRNILVAVMEKDLSVSLILSYNMFSKMNVSINALTIRNKIHQISPVVRISALKDEYYVKYSPVILESKISNMLYNRFGCANLLDSIYVFSQG